MGYSSLHFNIIDPDVIDAPSNLRRITGSSAADLEARAPKAEVVARHIRQLDLGTTVEPLPVDIRTENAARRLLDVDVVISTTDTHSSRALVNQVAMQYYVPTIDVGVRVGTGRDGSISGMPVDVRLLLPGEPCLWCRGVLDAGLIREETCPRTNENACGPRATSRDSTDHNRASQHSTTLVRPSSPRLRCN